MKILKLPVDTKISCECGCEFEFEPEDVKVSSMFSNNIQHNFYYIHCPFCKKSHNLNTKPEEAQRHCADCRYFESIIYKDDATQEWVTQFRCKKDCNILAVEPDSCDYFVGKA